jgi:dethiobiotin synthetase
MQSLFVSGTDTGAGKTVAVAALLSVLLDNKVDAVPMKPIQTGCELHDGVWSVPDLEFVKEACGLSFSSEDQELSCPYKFEPACSPHLAAEKARTTISLDKIIESFATLQSRHDMVVAEGAGGIMVPIDKDTMMLDLMKALNLPVVLATRPGLGTINHTLLSINELRRAGLSIAGIIFCETKPPARDFIEIDNRKTIE